MSISLIDMKAQYTTLREEIRAAVDRVLESGHFILGPEVEAFEKDFARYCGVRHAVGLNNGTTALYLALLALGIGPGDEVVTVSQTFVATAEAISWTGARPVFVDVDPATYTIVPAKAERAINKKTKAIIPVHLYGHPADMDPLMALARKHRLKVIEDAAQAHGALYRGKPVGSFGDAACFSFYPSKNLGANGEAGAVVTQSEKLATHLRKLRNHGSLRKDKPSQFVGWNARMEAIQGAILKVKLHYLNEWNQKRREAAARYRELLRETSLALPQEAPAARSVYHLYVVRSKRRAALHAHLNQRGVLSQIHYPTPVHLLPCYRSLRYRKGSLPVTEQLCREVLSLPLYPEITESQIREVAAVILEFDAR